jgi:hypothetical protein
MQTLWATFVLLLFVGSGIRAEEYSWRLFISSPPDEVGGGVEACATVEHGAQKVSFRNLSHRYTVWFRYSWQTPNGEAIASAQLSEAGVDNATNSNTSGPSEGSVNLKVIEVRWHPLRSASTPEGQLPPGQLPTQIYPGKKKE